MRHLSDSQRTPQWVLLGTALLLLITTAASARAAEPYRLQPGDVLLISVWKEVDLQGETMVRPDGGISFPLVGDIQAEGRNVEEVRTLIAEKLRKLIPDAMVTVVLRQIGGNRVYVLGKVNRPGEFPFNKSLDVMQALSLAGGATPYASLDEILILRRRPDAARDQIALPFRFSEVEKGRKLEQNILLQSGDTVVVP